MVKRDTFRGQEYWDGHVQFLVSVIPKHEAQLAARDVVPERRYVARYAIFRDQLKLLIARYSRGEDIVELRHALPDIIAALAAYFDEPGYRPVDFEQLDNYVEVLSIVSLAILLDASQHDLERLLGLIDNEGQDALFERLAERPVSSILLYPRPYEFLYRALDTEGQERDQLIKEFLSRYYRGLRHTYWHNTHLLPKGGGFFGYWCFELAAFVKVLHIPDQSFADNVYYPRDLVRVP